MAVTETEDDVAAAVPLVELSGVSRRFGSTHALRGVDFRLDEPGIVAVVGVNGSGKTTLLRTAVGLIPPTTGTIRVGGVDPWRHPERAHRIVGYVPEAPRPYPGMTVRKYLDFVATVCRTGGERAAAVDSAVRRFNLSNVLGQRCGTLSLGYRQRLALAQADITDPPVLVLDEPMNGLDPRQMSQLRNLLRTWSATRAVVLSSHLISEVQDLAREVVLLHAGRVVARFDTAPVVTATGKRLWMTEENPSAVDVVLLAGRSLALRWSDDPPGPCWRPVGERSSRSALEDLFLACLSLTEEVA